MQLCAQLLHFSLSDAIFKKHEFWNDYKAVDGHRTNKNGVHTGARCPLSCPSTKSRPGTRAPATCPNSSVGVLEKRVC